jgi:molybdopterin molybdotransferase
MATGDELAPPGGALGPAQVVASNAYGVAAMAEGEGAEARLLPIARDDRASLEAGFALAEGADLLLTIGGASVGEHDLVAPVARGLGMDAAFHRVAMRPGKPLMAGRLGPMAVLGVPGNPVSALVCARVFMLPMIRRMLGLPTSAPTEPLPLSRPLDPNGPRRHYMRARREDGGVGVMSRQDSSLLSILASAELLVVRPPHDPARKAGEIVECLHLAGFDSGGERS